MTEILIVEKSVLIQNALKHVLGTELGTITTTLSCQNALFYLEKHKPRIVIIDPASLEGHCHEFGSLCVQTQAQVVILTSEKEQDLVAFESVTNLDILDFIVLPEKTSDEILLRKDQIRRVFEHALSDAKESVIIPSDTFDFSPTRKKILLIATSTGGPQTLELLLKQIPAQIPVPVLIVQHMPAAFTKSFAERLNRVCDIEIREAQEGDELKKGVALLAPGNKHMELVAEVEGLEGTIHLTDEERELGVRPCANKLFVSVAKIFKENTIGVVLTGMGSDGTRGSQEIKRLGGTIIAQSEKTSIIYGMPKSVVEAHLADEIVDIENMGVALLQIIDI